MKVDEYIEKQKPLQKEICRELRKLILETFPGIKEEFKMGVPWYEDRYYIVALKDHVNMGFCVSGLTKKEMDLLEGNGRYMRHVKFFSLKDIDKERLVKLLRMTKSKKNTCDKIKS